MLKNITIRENLQVRTFFTQVWPISSFSWNCFNYVRLPQTDYHHPLLQGMRRISGKWEENPVSLFYKCKCAAININVLIDVRFINNKYAYLLKLPKYDLYNFSKKKTHPSATNASTPHNFPRNCTLSSSILVHSS